MRREHWYERSLVICFEYMRGPRRHVSARSPRPVERAFTYLDLTSLCQTLSRLSTTILAAKSSVMISCADQGT
jgi:hypothetical protein